MGSPPNGDHLRPDKRSKVHIRRIHTQKDIQTTDQRQFMIQPMLPGHVPSTRILKRPLIENRLFVAFSAEQKDRHVVLPRQGFDDFLHLVNGINLPAMLGKRRDADPFTLLQSMHHRQDVVRTKK